MTAADPRDTGRWRALRASMRRTATHCGICGALLDHRNPRGKRYPTIDHVLPLHTYPHLAYERSNLRVVCNSCNASRGAAYGNRIRQPAAPRWPRRQPPRSTGTPGPGW